MKTTIQMMIQTIRRRVYSTTPLNNNNDEKKNESRYDCHSLEDFLDRKKLSKIDFNRRRFKVFSKFPNDNRLIFAVSGELQTRKRIRRPHGEVPPNTRFYVFNRHQRTGLFPVEHVRTERRRREDGDIMSEKDGTDESLDGRGKKHSGDSRDDDVRQVLLRGRNRRRDGVFEQQR